MDIYIPTFICQIWLHVYATCSHISVNLYSCYMWKYITHTHTYIYIYKYVTNKINTFFMQTTLLFVSQTICSSRNMSEPRAHTVRLRIIYNVLQWHRIHTPSLFRSVTHHNLPVLFESCILYLHRCTCCAQTPQIKRSTGSCCSVCITVWVQAVPELDKNKAQICCSERTSGTGYC